MMKHDVAGAMLPTLLPIFGGTDKKPRLVDRDVIAVGRARGCDVALEANEVSAVHCIFYRAGDGLRLRDCGSRTGTKVNGNPIKNILLTDGDVVQIGPFSFEVRLPPNFAPAKNVDEKEFVHLERSRRGLARLAVGLRRKLKSLPRSNGEAGAKALALQDKMREYDQRFEQLQAGEQAVAQERATLAREREAAAQRVQQVEADLAQRLAQAEADIRAQWTEFQQRCTAEEQRLQETAMHTATALALKNDASASARLQELDRRDHELRAQEEASNKRTQELSEAAAAIERQRDDFQQQRNLFQTESAKARQELDQQRVGLAQGETALREQRAELTKMVADIKRLQEDLRKQSPELRGLSQENQQLRQQLAALEQRQAAAVNAEQIQAQLAEREHAKQALEQNVRRLLEENDVLRQRVTLNERAGSGRELDAYRRENEQLRRLLQDQILKPSGSAELESLRAENEQLRQLLTEIERSGLNTPQDGDDMKQLRSELELLRELLQEKDKVLDEVRATATVAPEIEQELTELREEVARLREQTAASAAEVADVPPRGDNDLETYEAELNRYRQQLGSDRNKLNAEIEALRTRNTELDEATREMEMELSRERAELARERMRLDRMRDEVKSEMERLQRDGGVRESLANVERLRDEMRATRR